jgi:hypothetical protein
MRLITAAAAAAAALAIAAPAEAQNRRSVQQQPGTSSQLAQQVTASGDQPDVLLDIPNLSVDELTIEVDNLQAHIALDARLANLLKLTAGADASVDNVKIQLKGVQAQATLVVRLDNVRAIIERTLQTLDANPELVARLLSTVDNTVSTVGGVANNALPVVGGVANNAVNTVGGVANNALQNGQVLDLVRTGLTEVSRTVNSAGQTVRRVQESTGGLIEVVTDSAGRIVSSRRVNG